MASPARSIPRVGDAIVLTFFEKLEEELGFGSFSLRIFGAQGPITRQRKEIISSLSEINGTQVQYASASKTVKVNKNPPDAHIEVRFERGEPQANGTTTPSLYIDSIRIEDQQNVDPKLALEINSVIERYLVARANPPVEAPNNLLGLVDAHRQQISNLGNALERVGVSFAGARISLEQEVDERKKVLQAEYEKKLREIDDQLREREIALNEEAEKLEKRKNQLDDRDNTHVRRELRDQFRKHISSFKDRFRLSKDTQSLRLPIHVTVILIEFVCLSLIYLNLTTLGAVQDVWDRVLFALKTVGLTFFAAGTAIWYLKWLTRWSDRHADGEFHLRQLELDMERANWAVETTFEWKNTQEASIPDPLIESITRNLFVRESDKGEREESPVDHLASALLGEASKAKLNIAGNELHFERSALRKAGKPD